MVGLDQLVSRYFKRCFSCNKLKHLLFFKVNHKKYQLPYDKGVMVDCRLCGVRRFIKQDGSILQYNFTTNRYDTIINKVTLINKIKIYFK